MGFLRRCFDLLFEDVLKYRDLGVCGKNVVIPDGFKVFGKNNLYLEEDVSIGVNNSDVHYKNYLSKKQGFR